MCKKTVFQIRSRYFLFKAEAGFWKREGNIMFLYFFSLFYNRTRAGAGDREITWSRNRSEKFALHSV